MQKEGLSIRFRHREPWRDGRSSTNRAPSLPKNFGGTSTATQSSMSTAGVISVSTADYKYQNQLQAVVDVYTMKDSAGARKVFEADQAGDAGSVQVGDAGIASGRSVTFRKGPFLVRIVAYNDRPGTQQALIALAHGVESKSPGVTVFVQGKGFDAALSDEVPVRARQARLALAADSGYRLRQWLADGDEAMVSRLPLRGRRHSALQIERRRRRAMDEFFQLGPDGSGYDAIPEASYDFVILNHVVEHMREPAPIVAALCKEAQARRVHLDCISFRTQPDAAALGRRDAELLRRSHARLPAEGPRSPTFCSPTE